MRKTFLGVKLKTLREQRGLTQAALAQQLELSPSYLNQLENNQRPLSVAVQLRLQSALGVDLQLFSDDDEARLTSQLQDVVAQSPDGGGVSQAELRAMAQQMPGLAQVLIRLHHRSRDAEGRLQAQLHRHAQRPLVVLELVEVAGRELELLGERRLRQAALLAQGLELHAEKGLAHGIFANIANYRAMFAIFAGSAGHEK